MRLDSSLRKGAIGVERDQFIGRFFSEGLWGHPGRNGDGRTEARKRETASGHVPSATDAPRRETDRPARTDSGRSTSSPRYYHVECSIGESKVPMFNILLDQSDVAQVLATADEAEVLESYVAEY